MRFSAGIERSQTSRLHVYPELGRQEDREGMSLHRSHHHIPGGARFRRTLTSSSGPAASTWSRWTDGGGVLRADSDVYLAARLAAAADALIRARDYAALRR